MEEKSMSSRFQCFPQLGRLCNCPPPHFQPSRCSTLYQCRIYLMPQERYEATLRSALMYRGQSWTTHCSPNAVVVECQGAP
eukprot:443783-Amphidinium_carterae.2